MTLAELQIKTGDIVKRHNMWLILDLNPVRAKCIEIITDTNNKLGDISLLSPEDHKDWVKLSEYEIMELKGEML